MEKGQPGHGETGWRSKKCPYGKSDHVVAIIASESLWPGGDRWGFRNSEKEKGRGGAAPRPQDRLTPWLGLSPAVYCFVL